jgi:hypothetical protein
MTDEERELDFLVAALQEEINDLKEGLAFVTDENLRMRQHIMRIQAVATLALDIPTVERARGLQDLEPGQEKQ